MRPTTTPFAPGAVAFPGAAEFPVSAFASTAQPGTNLGFAKQLPTTPLFDLTLKTPPKVKAGTYQVSLRCSNGHSSVATFTVTDKPVAWAKQSAEVARPGDTVRFGLRCDAPSGIPTSKQSPRRVDVTLPGDIRTGRVYHVSMQCSNGASATADLAVLT